MEGGDSSLWRHPLLASDGRACLLFFGFSIDCAGILKLRNSDIELRKGETDIGRKNTRVRLVFRVHVPQGSGKVVSVQTASVPIECCEQRGPVPSFCLWLTSYLCVCLPISSTEYAVPGWSPKGPSLYFYCGWAGGSVLFSPCCRFGPWAGPEQP